MKKKSHDTKKARKSGPKKLSRVQKILRHPGACSSFCVSTREGERVGSGTQKRKISVKKVGKDTPHLSYLPTLYNRTKCALPSFVFSRGAAWEEEESSSRNRAERSAVSFSLSLSLSLRDVASSPVESHDWNSKKIIFDVANGNENGFLCFFFYDDDERQ